MITDQQIQAAIKIAADSINSLRMSDVFRVLEQNAASIRSALADYISQARPDLAGEVAEIVAEGF